MNNIELAKVYTPLLDEAYKQASLTAVLDGSADLMREGFNADEIIIPMLEMSGLGNYSRNDGYVKGDVTLTWETVKTNFDRGRMFVVDELDNIETGGIAFGRLAGEFIRTKVVPELDAFRLSKYAQLEDISRAYGELETGADVIAALRACTNQMDEDEVPYEDRYLFITPTLLGLIDDLDTTKSRAVLARYSLIIPVPQTRFYSEITQYDGSTDGQTGGGYVKAEGATDINFLCVHRPAAIQFNKLVRPKIITPDMNQDADSWKYGYRLVSLCNAYENKMAGFYCHTVENMSDEPTEPVTGVYTVTIGGTVASGDKITVDGTEVTLNSSTGASVTAAAAAVVTALGSNANYTAESEAGVITLTEKTGKEGTGQPTASIVSTAGTVTVATVTAGVAASE